MKLYAITPVLLVAACATPASEEQPVVATIPPTIGAVQGDAGSVAMGALKGAGRGAYGCAMPTLALGQAGLTGLVIGGAITLVCLPFGIVGGAVIGGISAAAPIGHSAAVPETVN
jgi:hypothetical protein